MTARKHFDEFLAPLHPWISGDFETACGNAQRQFEAIGLSAEKNNLAVDLGCGDGAHSIALGRLGFHVQGVDPCSALLTGLRENAAREALPVTAFESDVVTHMRSVNGAPGVITCMGDTLAHLGNERDVAEMIQLASRRLARGGTFLISFSDHSSKLGKGDRVEIPIRRREGQIFTRRLEGLENSILVIDELAENRTGRWVTRASSYEALRLKPGWIAAELRRAGLKISRKENREGRFTIVATKPFPFQAREWMTALTSSWRIAS